MLKFIALLCSIVVYVYADCSSSITRVGGDKAPAAVCSGELIFQDEFDTFDLTTWKHENTLSGGGNSEFQWYTNNRSNSYVSDGVLYIAPTFTSDVIGGEEALSSATITINENCTDSSNNGCERTGTSENILNPIRSARIRTTDSFHFTYGRVEIRAKMPKGDWLWSAIWMLPHDNVYGDWPASGEIDISQVRGNADLLQNEEQIGVQQHCTKLHWGPTIYDDKWPLTYWTTDNAAGWNDDFHVYGVTWTNESITLTIDEETVGTIKPMIAFWEVGGLENSGSSNPWVNGTNMAPFDQNFHIILNLAVGGNDYFPDDAANGNGAKPWNNTSGTGATNFWNDKDQWYATWDGVNSTLQVDYVRVYAL